MLIIVFFLLNVTLKSLDNILLHHTQFQVKYYINTKNVILLGLI